MKKLVIITFLTSIGITSNAWSASGETTELLQGIGEIENVNMVPKPGRPVPPK